MRLGVLSFLGVLFLFSASCLTRSDVPPEPPKRTNAALKKVFERANKLDVAHDDMQIQGYMRRNALDSMLHDGRGMYYKVWGKPLGPLPREGVHVAIAYRTELLDGTLCESSDTISPLELIVGKRAATIGLDELLLHVAPGQEAIAIVPPHLAYGIPGKGNKIPSQATIVYRITWLRYPKQ